MKAIHYFRIGLTISIIGIILTIYIKEGLYLTMLGAATILFATYKINN